MPLHVSPCKARVRWTKDVCVIVVVLLHPPTRGQRPGFGRADRAVAYGKRFGGGGHGPARRLEGEDRLSRPYFLAVRAGSNGPARPLVSPRLAPPATVGCVRRLGRRSERVWTAGLVAADVCWTVIRAAGRSPVRGGAGVLRRPLRSQRRRV
ncbi:hypothetical protein GCM10020221_25610 [Streptomyces thioluteus]|uniref:Uncharacterized protein n=1 Tax=Streptomyces thioluteus TaxID=66431 RepID=A0ABN3WUS5_STRTU